MSDVLVIGCGLMGTSIGLALRGSAWDDVALADLDSRARDTAVARGAGRAWDGAEPAELAVVCVPPAVTAYQVIELQRLDVAQTYTHVCSVQAGVQAEIESLSTDPSSVLGGHPLAGREVSGPSAAVADLFVGRPWALCPGTASAPGASTRVRRLAELCGAIPVEVSPEVHDAAVALTSHLPQLVSTALAALLLARPAEEHAVPLGLSGPGLVDTTRLAGSNPALWTEILAANAGRVAPLIRGLVADLSGIASALQALGDAGGAEEAVRDEARATVAAFLERGREGRGLVPVKRGEGDDAFAGVRVELADAPGELARLFAAAGDAGVNIEDVRLEHVPGRPQGVAELVVTPAAHSGLTQHLQRGGWHVFM